MSATNVTAGVEPRKRRKHRHRWTNLTETRLYQLVFAHLGKFSIVAAYYVLTQWLHGQLVNFNAAGQNIRFRLWNVKYTWDHAFTNSIAHGGVINIMSESAWTPMRHIVFRGLIEGTLGVILFKQLGFNVEKYRAKLEPEPSRVDRLILRSRVVASPYQDYPVTGVQYLFLPVIVVLATILLGVPTYLAVHYGLAHAAHWTWLEPHLAAHQSIWQKVYVGDYDGLIIGVLVGIAVGRTYRAYLYANAMNWGRTWVARGGRPHWWMPEPTRNLIRDLQAEGVARQRTVLSERSGHARRIAAIGVLVFVAAAAYGYYILAHFAH